MTAREIAERLLGSEKGVTLVRVAKAQALAKRSNVEWSAVLAAMTNEEADMVREAR